MSNIWCQIWRKGFKKENKETLTLSEGEKELVTNVFALHDKEAGDCMVPRARIVAEDVNEPPDVMLELMNQSGHSRVPVYRDTLDNTIGFVHMKDIVLRQAKKEAFTLHDILRPILFIAPSMPVSKLIMRMRQTRQHMAVVIDEFGGVDGLVTIEDLIEEIVGDIEDEHDAPVGTPIIARADGTLLVEASLPIEDFEKRAGDVLSFEERESIDTLAGYVIHLAGCIPEVGETIDGPRGLKFDILEADSNRIKRVRVRGLNG